MLVWVITAIYFWVVGWSQLWFNIVYRACVFLSCYSIRIDRFTTTVGYRLSWFETFLQYQVQFWIYSANSTIQAYFVESVPSKILWIKVQKAFEWLPAICVVDIFRKWNFLSQDDVTSGFRSWSDSKRRNPFKKVRHRRKKAIRQNLKGNDDGPLQRLTFNLLRKLYIRTKQTFSDIVATSCLCIRFLHRFPLLTLASLLFLLIVYIRCLT